MNRPTDLYGLRRAAMWRLNGSRNPDIRVFATDLVDVADTEEHYRWLLRARMTEISAWATDIIAGVRANRKATLP